MKGEVKKSDRPFGVIDAEYDVDINFKRAPLITRSNKDDRRYDHC